MVGTLLVSLAPGGSILAGQWWIQMVGVLQASVWSFGSAQVLFFLLRKFNLLATIGAPRSALP